jgi:hypothetical protein
MRWRARRDSNSRPSGSKPFDLLIYFAKSCNLARGVANRTDSASWGKFLQPTFSIISSFVAIRRGIATVFRNLRDIFVTAPHDLPFAWKSGVTHVVNLAALASVSICQRHVSTSALYDMAYCLRPKYPRE